MSIFHASFQKARSGMLTNICEIEKVVELTDEEYERFSQNLTVSSELLSQESDRFRVDEHGIARCLLVMAEGRQDGTLVLTEGYDYARHTAHLPNARQFLKMEQSFRLAEFVDRMHSLTNQFVADAIDRQVEGEYKVSLAPIRNKVVNDSFSASLFMEMLSERPEIAEVDYDYQDAEGNTIVFTQCHTKYYNADPAAVTGLHTEAIESVVTLPEEYENCTVGEKVGAWFKKGDRAFLCWTISAEVSCVIEYSPESVAKTDVFKMAESVAPIKAEE